MKISKITFRNNQAWLCIKSEAGEYLGTWHVTNTELVNAIRKENPKNIKVWGISTSNQHEKSTQHERESIRKELLKVVENSTGVAEIVDAIKHL